MLATLSCFWLRFVNVCVADLLRSATSSWVSPQATVPSFNYPSAATRFHRGSTSLRISLPPVPLSRPYLTLSTTLSDLLSSLIAKQDKPELPMSSFSMKIEAGQATATHHLILHFLERLQAAHRFDVPMERFPGLNL